MNKVEIKEKEVEKNPSQQTKLSVPQNEEENRNLENLHVQRKKWKGNNVNVLCWGFFYANDSKDADGDNAQIMKCIFCYNMF
jgi:hypothetical protein